jgi:hypothetical protein
MGHEKDQSHWDTFGRQIESTTKRRASADLPHITAECGACLEECAALGLLPQEIEYSLKKQKLEELEAHLLNQSLLW